ncbi:hypothetical protein RF11_11064 [Thelohanellus kitauei]|uniref:Uncharacterized protein n=1 Tax=Thelohanellus kitauei TaxID=669202 RepID=A0A0C2MZ46_THEKT|nr:hypothetical protein RF11_11064 [Thelohanellus kitauei]
MYYLMSHAIVDGAKLHMDSLERFIENESTIHALCAPLKGVAKVYSATGDFHCSKAAKDIYNCLKNYGVFILKMLKSEFKVSSSSSSGITGVLKLLLNAFG